MAGLVYFPPLIHPTSPRDRGRGGRRTGRIGGYRGEQVTSGHKFILEEMNNSGRPVCSPPISREGYMARRGEEQTPLPGALPSEVATRISFWDDGIEGYLQLCDALPILPRLR